MTDAVFKFDSKCGTFEMVVKREFLEKVPNPADTEVATLLKDHNMGQYFHNPFGPAIYVKRSGYAEYWIDGKKTSQEVAEKIMHDSKFNNDFNEDLKS